MFDFLSMADDYEERKIERFEGLGMVIDTCRVTDSDDPFETAVQHPNYHDNDWVIVETYSDKDSAVEGHKKWVDIMTTNPPSALVDVSNSTVYNMLKDMQGGNSVFYKEE